MWQSGDGCASVLHELVKLGHEINLYQAVQGRRKVIFDRSQVCVCARTTFAVKHTQPVRLRREARLPLESGPDVL